jgi:crossover junction endodeoxyribonuclease RuvC
VRVLGVDPGYGRVGWGIVSREASMLKAQRWGLIETDPADEWSKRLSSLYERFDQVLALEQPDIVAAEALWFGANRTTAMGVAKAAGVLALATTQHGLQFVEYKPSVVKLTVTGNGAARKPQVRAMVGRLLGSMELPRVDDVADALAVAICHLQHSRLGLLQSD